MSNKQEREKRREERLREESKVESKDRRTRLLQFGAGAVFLVIAAVVVLIVVNSSNSKSGGDAANVKEVAEVEHILAGIPQNGMTLGDPKAPVELIEYGDLQCPICKEYSEEDPAGDHRRPGQAGAGQDHLPQLHHHQRRIGPRRRRGAGRRPAGSGLELHRALLPQPGRRALRLRHRRIHDLDRQGRGSRRHPDLEQGTQRAKLTEEVEATTREAERLGFTGTPSFAIKGPGTNGMELLGTLQSTGEFEEAINKAS